MEAAEFINAASDEPEAILRGLEPYRITDCLKVDKGSSAYLCQDPDTGEKALAKISIQPEDIRQMRNEFELLKLISESGDPRSGKFSRPICFIQPETADDHAALLRSWFPGRSVESMVEQKKDKPGLSAEESVSIILSVLERLAFLHDLNPPIIHRDIKPQNVIVSGQGECFLIDLGISRVYQKGKDGDTNIAGTRNIAPPEQFGYSQTDARSDIYSVGILLRYCLTGEYRVREDKLIDKGLDTIIKKAIRFDPDRRYQSAEDMAHALRQWSSPVSKIGRFFAGVLSSAGKRPE